MNEYELIVLTIYGKIVFIIIADNREEVVSQFYEDTDFIYV